VLPVLPGLPETCTTPPDPLVPRISLILCSFTTCTCPCPSPCPLALSPVPCPCPCPPPCTCPFTCPCPLKRSLLLIKGMHVLGGRSPLELRQAMGVRSRAEGPGTTLANKV
jgi:hypothetical protein